MSETTDYDQLTVIPAMTEQQVFDRVATHLFTQGRRASRPGSDDCRYRTEEGLKCAVGCLIPDALYVPEMDENAPGGGYGFSAEELIDNFSVLEPLAAHQELLLDLQSAHDGSSTWSGGPPGEFLRERLGSIAEKFELDKTTLNGLKFNTPLETA